MFFIPRGPPTGRPIDTVLEARQIGPKTFQLRILDPPQVDLEAFNGILDRIKTCLGSSDIMKVDESALTLEITTDYPDVRARCLYNEGINVSFVEEEKVLLNEVQVAPKAYEVRIHGMSELPDYETALRNASACVEAGDRAYVATSWSTKYTSLIAAVASQESFVQCLNQKGLSLEATELNFPLTELSHEFITARSEFEFLMEELSRCVNEDDRLYLAYEPFKNRHCILLASKDMNAVRTRLAATSIQLVAKQP